MRKEAELEISDFVKLSPHGGSEYELSSLFVVLEMHEKCSSGTNENLKWAGTAASKRLHKEQFVDDTGAVTDKGREMLAAVDCFLTLRDMPD